MASESLPVSLYLSNPSLIPVKSDPIIVSGMNTFLSAFNNNFTVNIDLNTFKNVLAKKNDKPILTKKPSTPPFFSPPPASSISSLSALTCIGLVSPADSFCASSISSLRKKSASVGLFNSTNCCIF